MDIVSSLIDVLIKITDGHPSYLIVGLGFFVLILCLYWYMINIYPLKKLSSKINDLATKEDIKPVATKLDELLLMIDKYTPTARSNL